MTAFLRIVPATCSVQELRRRLQRLCEQGREYSDEYFELAGELFRRTNGEEGVDIRLAPWVRLLKPSG